VPAIYYNRFFSELGGLISYGDVRGEQFRLAAGYIDRILKGEKPADLPVQVPTKFELIINLKTAKARLEVLSIQSNDTNVTLLTRGAISLSTSTPLPPSDPTIGVKPVTLPPGCARLVTKPLPMGSPTSTKITGMVRVC
jgi:ABC transporter substrate binding protein